ncbi:hypothetical protein H310_00142 [Aphanomyces invadans]|uniref:Uncharacterized protein n=1 Tax=Aphanomyces invadans TaxID=157072 RepID=A0A024UTC9_9STRA|nr:hypothetical protein H310_00142 [Aphanomyces invadans]ETW09604.1 hypothetical protein H310_00142 [Aphanomyces invadans]|eukprot:XP_008861015.1 hypothetical protein H310_00142 [Aphanomyces invadans]
MATPSSVTPSSTEPTTVAPFSPAPSTTLAPQTSLPATTTSPSTTKPSVTTTSSPPVPITSKPANSPVEPSATPSMTSVTSTPSPSSSTMPTSPERTTVVVSSWPTLPFSTPAPQQDVPDIQNVVAAWANDTTVPPSTVPNTPSNPGNNQAMLIAIIACATLAVFLVAFFVILFLRRRARGSESDGRGDDGAVFLGTPPSTAFNSRSSHRNPHVSPRQRHRLSKLTPRSLFQHSAKQPTPTSTSNASCTAPSPVDFSLDYGGVEYHNSFARSAASNRSFAVDDIRDDDSAGSYRSDDANGSFDLRLSTPASSDARSLSFSYRVTSPGAATPSSVLSVTSDLAMLDDGQRRSSGASSNFSIPVECKEDLVGGSCHDDQFMHLHDDAMKVTMDRQDRRPSSVCSDMSSYHI